MYGPKYKKVTHYGALKIAHWESRQLYTLRRTNLTEMRVTFYFSDFLHTWRTKFSPLRRTKVVRRSACALVRKFSGASVSPFLYLGPYIFVRRSGGLFVRLSGELF